jgi:hypothetical protein
LLRAWRVCHAFWRVQPAATANRSVTDRIRAGGADKSPLGAHLFEAAQQELAESARLFDLSEHRFGQLFAQPVGAGVSAGLDLGVIGKEDYFLSADGALMPSRKDQPPPDLRYFKPMQRSGK